MTSTRFPLRYIFAAVMVVVLVAAAACSGGDSGTSETTTIDGLPPEFQRLSEVWELINREAIDNEDIDPLTISDGAIRGMLMALGDPYAGFLDREQFSLESEDIRGFFGGIGAEVGVRDGAIIILSPMPDAPAEAAGIKAGDVILEVDGMSIRGLSLLEVVQLIRGDRGTKVTLLLRQLNNPDPVSIEIERDIINLESVTLLMQVGRIGQLRLSGFTGTTNDDLEKALERFERSQGVGLVLDLRNNPGGLVSAVVDVTSQFIKDGLVLYQIDANGNRRDWKGKSGGKAMDIPIGSAREMDEVLADDHFARRRVFQRGRHPAFGSMTYIQPPYRTSRGRWRRPAPAWSPLRQPNWCPANRSPRSAKRG